MSGSTRVELIAAIQNLTAHDEGMPVGLAELGWEAVTNPPQSAEGQSSSEGGTQAEPPPPPPPNRDWIEFDLGLRGQDPAVIERRNIERGD